MCFVASQLVNTNERNKLVVNSYLQLAANGRAVAFCVSIEHAEDLSAMFQ
jgi:superfamily II DNA or RNA helicase